VYVQNYDAIGRVCAIGASGSTCSTGTRSLNSPTYNAAAEPLSVTFGNNVQGAFTYNVTFSFPPCGISKIPLKF